MPIESVTEATTQVDDQEQEGKNDTDLKGCFQFGNIYAGISTLRPSSVGWREVGCAIFPGTGEHLFLSHT